MYCFYVQLKLLKTTSLAILKRFVLLVFNSRRTFCNWSLWKTTKPSSLIIIKYKTLFNTNCTTNRNKLQNTLVQRLSTLPLFVFKMREGRKRLMMSNWFTVVSLLVKVALVSGNVAAGLIFTLSNCVVECGSAKPPGTVVFVCVDMRCQPFSLMQANSSTRTHT